MIKRFSLIIISIFFISLSASFAATIQLPQTGQTNCYNASGDICICGDTTCPPGQDGEIRAGVAWPEPRFTDNGSTVTDNLTGLIWLKDANCTATQYPNSDNDDVLGDGQVTWQHALDFIAGINGGLYPNCNGGSSDWRLPNINEIESLANLGHPWGPGIWLNSQGFNNVQYQQQRWYWSSTTVANPINRPWTDNAYIYGMRYGVIHPGGFKSSSSYYVWPVRSTTSGSARVWNTGQTTSYAPGDDGDIQAGVAWPNPRFTDNGSTVTDNLTGLIWLKDANCTATQYPNSDNDDVLGDGQVTWQHALDFIAGINEGLYPNCNGGSSDWRLPNRKEFYSLIDFSQSSPALSPGHLFDNVQFLYASQYYWSSTTDPGWAVRAWVVNILFDGLGYPNKSDTHYYVWPVRGGQVLPPDEPDISISPSAHNFGSINIGASSAPQTFTISNTGTADLHISGMALSDTTNYSLNVNGGTSPCGSTTPSITTDSSCTITVTFSPSSTGTKDANLAISSDDPDTPTLNVPLNGIGVQDTTPPTIVVIGCPLKVNLNTLSSVRVTVTDSESGVAYQSAPNGNNVLDTSGVGTKTFTVTASDNRGNTGTNSCIYQVVYDFSGAGGFQPPVDDPPITNTAKAGSTIPVKWQLPNGSGGFISDLGAVISIKAQQVACSNFSSTLTDPVDTTATGDTVLRYDLTINQYIYNWKTYKTWAGKCYILNLTLNDGMSYQADFSLK